MRNPFARIVGSIPQRRSALGLLIACLAGALVGGLAGCSGSSSIPNLTQSAPALPGNEVYAGPRMNVPRYSHTATTLEDGTVLVIGGTDEIHLTAIDRVEIFDQSSRVDITEPIPESIAGDFIDQDVDGNLITLNNGGRFFHSATAIEDGNVLVIGGTTSDIFGTSIGPSEIYDPLTRTFGATQLQIDPADDIEFPRARHSAYRMSNGRVLVSGGQESETITLPPQTGVGGIPIQQTQEARPSTKSVEIFDPATLSFSQATDLSGLLTQLTTSRGRSVHATAQWAGFDNLYNTGDDVYGFLGGYMTLSAASLGAPEDYLPWSPLTTKLTSMDFYDATSGTINLAQGLVLHKRADAVALNLGAEHGNTPFGEPGMANAVFVLCGDSDETCPDGAPSVGEGTTDRGELVVATFTGFGPANGIRFTKVPEAVMVNNNCLPPAQTSTFANGHEYAIICCTEFNRSRCPAVLMEMLRTYDGQNFITSVVVTGGGIDITRRMQCLQEINGFCGDEVRGFAFYDPFYDIANNSLDARALDPAGPAVWDWTDNGTATNPLGIRGTMLHYDDLIPSNELDGYADGSGIVSMNQGRTMHSLSRIAGEDGLIGNLDDRIVAIGGTPVYLPLHGDDPLTLSCEIFLPPDAGIVP